MNGNEYNSLDDRIKEGGHPSSRLIYFWDSLFLSGQVRTLIKHPVPVTT